MPTVSTNAELMAALSSAVGGEVIELSAGDYGNLTLRNMAFPSDVTIISVDPLDSAVVRELDVNNSSHLVFDGILFDYDAGNDVLWERPFEIHNSSSYITIRNSVFDGSEVPDAAGNFSGTGFGLHVSGSSFITVENNEVYDFWKGISVGQSTDIVVSYNDVHTLRSDGFNFAAVDGLLIEGNWIHDFKMLPGSGDHADMIQFWTKVGDMSAKNVIIRANFFDAGEGDLTQTLFMRNGVVDMGQGSFEDYAYRNLRIEDNVIYNHHTHGISVGETDGLVLSNNTLLNDPNVREIINIAPRINLSPPSLNVTVENNILEPMWGWDATTNQPGWIVGNNLFVQHEDPTDENFYGDLFVNPFAIPATLADLRALPGGVIEVGAIGAAMTRADIPMLAGPYAGVLTPDPVPDPVLEPDMCEALLAESLTEIADLDVQLAVMTIARDTAQGERDAALALQAMAETERDNALTALTDAEAALAEMTVLWGEMVDALVVTETALTEMTTERDAALAAQVAALTDLAVTQTQLAVAVAKIDAALLALA